MISSPLRAAISAAYLEDENTVTERLIAKARLSPEERAATEKLARDLVLRIRETRGEQTGVDSLMQEYALSTQEGVVLMCLAESLLRVPDAATADKLIKDAVLSAQRGGVFVLIIGVTLRAGQVMEAYPSGRERRPQPMCHRLATRELNGPDFEHPRYLSEASRFTPRITMPGNRPGTRPRVPV